MVMLKGVISGPGAAVGSAAAELLAGALLAGVLLAGVELLGVLLCASSPPHAAMERTMVDASAPARILLATFFFIFYLHIDNYNVFSVM